jgi:hypothetical protein
MLELAKKARVWQAYHREKEVARRSVFTYRALEWDKDVISIA